MGTKTKPVIECALCDESIRHDEAAIIVVRGKLSWVCKEHTQRNGVGYG